MRVLAAVADGVGGVGIARASAIWADDVDVGEELDVE